MIVPSASSPQCLRVTDCHSSIPPYMPNGSLQGIFHGTGYRYRLYSRLTSLILQLHEHLQLSQQYTGPMLGSHFSAPAVPCLPELQGLGSSGTTAKAEKRKLVLPANTRKTNREAQQRFRLKQKVYLSFCCCYTEKNTLQMITFC